MTSPSEQFTAQFTRQFSAPLSAMGKSQLEAQLGMLQAFGARAIESAEQLISLNLRASRTSVEQVTGTFKQLLDATNPREIIAVGSRAQGQWHYLFDYGRELLSIASFAPVQSWTTQPTPAAVPAPQLTAPAPADIAPVAAAVSEAVSEVLDQVSIATADATTAATEFTSAVDTAQAQVETKADDTLQQFDAAVETAIADDSPTAKETLLVQALNKAAPKPASAEHPIASTIALEAHDHVELPVVTPVDTKPPVQSAKEQRRSPRSRK